MSSSEFTNYLRNSSPISRLQNTNKIPLQELHNSVDLKMSIFRHHPKNYLSPRNQANTCTKVSLQKSAHVPSTLEEFSEMKASSVIYKIPELSPPEINFQITDQLRQKISQIKEDIVTKLPTIKSSQFSSKKVESVLSRRTILTDLQTWLQQKLKTPPLTHEDSIQYKNMIMGVGMKEVIRLIGTRCAEQANIVNQIWQLTWSICREIILHLSKRAHTCEKILQEEASFFRVNCETKIKKNQQQVKQLFAQNTQLKERSDKLATDLASVKKKNKELKLTKMNLESSYVDLKQQFEVVFKQNLILHLKMTPNDQSRREWAKKKYKLYLNSTKKNDLMFKQFLQKILLQNDILFDQVELSQMDLRVDINKFKEERSRRMFQIQKQLHQSFKTCQRDAQTTIIQKKDLAMATEVKSFRQSFMSTQNVKCMEIGTNTEVVSEVKTKNKKQKQKILKKGGIDKKKNERKSTTIKNKSQIEEKNQKEQNELQEQETLQIDIKNNESNLEQKLKDQKEDEVKKNIQQNSPITERIKIEQPVQNTKQLKYSKRNQVNFQKQKIQQQIIVCQFEKKGQDTLQRTLIQTNPSSLINNSQLQAIKESQTKQALIIREEELAEEIKKLKQIIGERNNTIINLNKSVKNLSKKVDQIQERKNIVQVPSMDQQQSKDYHQLEKLLKNKKYPELLDAVQKKIYDNQIQVQGELNMNRIHLHSQRQVYGVLGNNPTHRRDHSFTYHNKQKTSQSKKDLYTQKFDFGEEDMIEQNNKYQIFDDLLQGSDQNPSGKSSKRTSFNSVSNNFKKYRNIKNGRNQCKYTLGSLRFVEVCNKYFYDNIQSDLSANNMIGKQAINNDYGKRFLRDQYKQIYRQVNESAHGEKTEKQMRIVIERSLNSLLKQLCKEIQNAQKQSLQKIQQVKISYIPLHILITNKFNLNFGVKKVASKHIKDLLICLKGIKKYTDRYSIISHFLLQSNSLKTSNSLLEAQDSELFFFYMLLITVIDGISSQRSVNKDQCFVIGQLAKKYLTRDTKLIDNIKKAHVQLQAQNCNTFVNLYKKIIGKYQQLSSEKTSQMQFIYHTLCKKNKQTKLGIGIAWTDFVKFVSIFSIKFSENEEAAANWQSVVLNTMIQTLLQEKSSENGMITSECFLKFVVKCPQFSVQSMRENIQSLIRLKQSECDLSNLEARQQVIKICSGDEYLKGILQYLFEIKSIDEKEIQFWLGFIKLYRIETNADMLIESLLTGVLDPRSQALILDKNRLMIG